MPEQPVPIYSDDELSALLKATEGTSFEDRRDHAIIRTLLDTGMRRSELTGIEVDDVDLMELQTILVRGTGSKVRACPRAVPRSSRSRPGSN